MLVEIYCFVFAGPYFSVSSFLCMHIPAYLSFPLPFFFWLVLSLKFFFTPLLSLSLYCSLTIIVVFFFLLFLSLFSCFFPPALLKYSSTLCTSSVRCQFLDILLSSNNSFWLEFLLGCTKRCGNSFAVIQCKFGPILMFHSGDVPHGTGHPLYNRKTGCITGHPVDQPSTHCNWLRNRVGI